MHTPASLLFFTAANPKYEDFIPLYAASALFSVEGCRVEIGLLDADAVRERMAGPLRVIADHFGPEALHLRNVAWARGKRAFRGGTARFIHEPETRAEFVYISDIDLIVLEQAFPAAQLAHMERTGLPYSNAVRPRTTRLTGCHFTRWDAYFPLPDFSDLDLRRAGDEEVLYEMVSRRGHQMPDGPFYRPLPGIHYSPHRDMFTTPERPKPGWGGVFSYPRQYWKLRNSPMMADLTPLLPERIQQSLRWIDYALIG